MLAQKEIAFLALCCILVAVPVSYTVNIYRMENFIHPSDPLISFIKGLPYIILAFVLFYGAYGVAKLIENGNHIVAGRLAVILIVLLVVALIVASLTFNIGIRYVM